MTIHIGDVFDYLSELQLLLPFALPPLLHCEAGSATTDMFLWYISRGAFDGLWLVDLEFRDYHWFTFVWKRLAQYPSYGASYLSTWVQTRSRMRRISTKFANVTWLLIPRYLYFKGTFWNAADCLLFMICLRRGVISRARKSRRRMVSIKGWSRRCEEHLGKAPPLFQVMNNPGA